jgi:hypothetical protein
MSDEQKLPENTTELLSQIETEWSALMDVVGKLDGIQMTSPDAGGWSPKDNLAHISEWMKVMLGYHMDHRPSHEVIGVAPEVAADWDADRINQVFFERNQARTVKDVSSELKEVYGRVMDRLKSTPFEELLKPRFPDQPVGPSLLEMGILNNTRDHFAEHRETMEKVLTGGKRK